MRLCLHPSIPSAVEEGGGREKGVRGARRSARAHEEARGYASASRAGVERTRVQPPRGRAEMRRGRRCGAPARFPGGRCRPGRVRRAPGRSRGRSPGGVGAAGRGGGGADQPRLPRRAQSAPALRPRPDVRRGAAAEARHAVRVGSSGSPFRRSSLACASLGTPATRAPQFRYTHGHAVVLTASTCTSTDCSGKSGGAAMPAAASAEPGSSSSPEAQAGAAPREVNGISGRTR